MINAPRINAPRINDIPCDEIANSGGLCGAVGGSIRLLIR